MDGADVARVMAAGAATGQLGTAFLRCPEAGTAEGKIVRSGWTWRGL